MKTSFAVIAALALAGCGSAPSPTASSPATAPASDPAPSSPAAIASSAAPADPPSPPPRPLDLANNCPNDVHLYFGDQPGDGKGQAVTVHAGTTTPVPRAADGTVVVWVTDDKGAGLASVHITKHMRHVRIDASCSKIDADSTR